jgi:MFS family permease
MRALLVLYMVKYYKLPQDYSSTVYKWYTSLVYLTPILGGFLADRYLGNKRAVLIGAVLMAIGHFLMAFEPYAAFYSALVFLILGNGMFKPNMSTQVGRLYPPNDPRRDGAYTIFYMGINLGAFLSPLICGWLADNTPWRYHAGFTAAGLGMLAGLLIYLFGQHLIIELPQGGEAPKTTPEKPWEPINEPSEDIARRSDVTGGPSTNVSLQGPDQPPGAPMLEAEAEREPSVVPWLNRMAPTLLFALGGILALTGPILSLTGPCPGDLPDGHLRRLLLGGRRAGRQRSQPVGGRHHQSLSDRDTSPRAHAA